MTIIFLIVNSPTRLKLCFKKCSLVPCINRRISREFAPCTCIIGANDGESSVLMEWGERRGEREGGSCGGEWMMLSCVLTKAGNIAALC